MRRQIDGVDNGPGLELRQLVDVGPHLLPQLFRKAKLDEVLLHVDDDGFDVVGCEGLPRRHGVVKGLFVFPAVALPSLTSTTTGRRSFSFRRLAFTRVWAASRPA